MSKNENAVWKSTVKWVQTHVCVNLKLHLSFTALLQGHVLQAAFHLPMMWILLQAAFPTRAIDAALTLFSFPRWPAGTLHGIGVQLLFIGHPKSYFKSSNVHYNRSDWVTWSEQVWKSLNVGYRLIWHYEMVWWSQLILFQEATGKLSTRIECLQCARGFCVCLAQTVAQPNRCFACKKTIHVGNNSQSLCISLLVFQAPALPTCASPA